MFSKMMEAMQGHETSSAQVVATAPETNDPAKEQRMTEGGWTAMEDSTLLRTMGWLTAGLGAVALGLVVGQELRSRYKFNRRTPYDFYAYSGDEGQEMEFGVGV